jgi:hypothetical protein
MFDPEVRPHESSKGKYPVEHRTCTDVFCLVAFIIFWIVSVVGVIYGFTKGDLKNIAQPYDSTGNKCGDGATKDYPYVFLDMESLQRNRTVQKQVYNQETNRYETRYVNITDLVSVCVKACPPTSTSPLDCYPNVNVTACSKMKVYGSELYMDRICLVKKNTAPGSVGNNTETVDLNESEKKGEASINDIKTAWPVYLICIALALILSYLYVYSLEKCAGAIIMTIVGLFVLSFIGLGILIMTSSSSSGSGSNVDESKIKTQDKSGNIVGGFIFIGMGLIMLLAVFCLWDRFKLAISVINAAADFLTDYPLILGVPIIGVILTFIYTAYCIVSGVYMWSVGDTRFEEGSPFGQMVYSGTTNFFQFVHLFAYFWNTCFIMYLIFFVIALTTVTWYFASDRRHLGSPICRGFSWALTYHFGSVALGSFLIAVVQIIKKIAESMKEDARSRNGNGGNRLAAECLASCIRCLEQLLKYISEHAYIEIVMKSTDFCTSAKRSFDLITHNIIRLGVLNQVTGMVVTFGSIAISLFTVLIAYLIMRWTPYYTTHMSSLLLPLIIIFILAYVVAQLFGNIIQASSDTIIHCYLVEEEETGHATAAPAGMSNLFSQVHEDHAPLNQPEYGNQQRQAEMQPRNNPYPQGGYNNQGNFNSPGYNPQQNFNQPGYNHQQNYNQPGYDQSPHQGGFNVQQWRGNYGYR